MRQTIFLAGCLLALSAVPAVAVIIAGPDGSLNAVAPSDDPGWANVGTIGGASGVYIGNYSGNHWVLTATHVGAGSITFASGTYAAVGGSAVTVRNGDNSTTDLTLFRIASDPGLPSLTLSSATPPSGTAVTTIGNGVNRGTAQLFWDVNTNGNPSGVSGGAAWTWTQLPDSTGADRSGFAWASGQTKRYGTNSIDSSATYDIGTGNTTAFVADFDLISGESQGATGDSGGAVFAKYNGNWVLVGIMGAIGTYNNQPGSHAIEGNVTYYASVPAYHAFITTAIPEPADVALWMAIAGSAVVIWRRRRSRCATV